MDEKDTAMRRFAHLLRAAKRHTGDPTLREIERIVELRASEGHKVRSVSPATLSRAMSGKTFPRWWTVEALLVGCGAGNSTAVYRKVRDVWMAVAEVLEPLGVDDDEFVENDEEAEGGRGDEETGGMDKQTGRLMLVSEPVPHRNVQKTGT